MKGLESYLTKFQGRLGARSDAIAAIILAVLAAASLSLTVITRTGAPAGAALAYRAAVERFLVASPGTINIGTGTPAGPALAYMAAVDRADVDYVWSHSVIDSSLASLADVVLLDKASLGAQLTASAHTRSNFSIQGWRSVSSGTEVTLTYRTQSGLATTTLLMRDASPNSWLVALDPAGMELTLPAGAGTASVDGNLISAKPASTTKLAVFPGLHRIALSGSQLFTPFSASVAADVIYPGLTPVSLAGLDITDQAASQARQVVSKVFQTCVAASDLRPANCPQSYTTDTASGAARWSMLIDPVTSSSVGLDSTSALVLSGHYLMRLSYTSATMQEDRQIAVGGPYAVTLQWDGTSLTVSGFGAASAVPALSAPAPRNAQILDALTTQFAICLTLQAGSSTGCPQSVAAFFASNFVWHPNGDPLQGASVAWDAVDGFYRVSGNFDYNVDYDSNPPYGATRHYQDHTAGQYVADIYWNGSNAVFVGFEE